MIDTFDAFEPWHWRRLLRVPWTARRSNQSILKEISPDYLLEGLMLKLKVQSFGDVMRRTNSLERPWCWERLKAGGQGDNRGWDGWIWHHQRDGHEFEQALGVDNGQKSLACCRPRDHEESDMTEWLNWLTDRLRYSRMFIYRRRIPKRQRSWKEQERQVITDEANSISKMARSLHQAKVQEMVQKGLQEILVQKKDGVEDLRVQQRKKERGGLPLISCPLL